MPDPKIPESADEDKVPPRTGDDAGPYHPLQYHPLQLAGVAFEEIVRRTLPHLPKSEGEWLEIFVAKSLKQIGEEADRLDRISGQRRQALEALIRKAKEARKLFLDLPDEPPVRRLAAFVSDVLEMNIRHGDFSSEEPDIAAARQKGAETASSVAEIGLAALNRLEKHLNPLLNDDAAEKVVSDASEIVLTALIAINRYMAFGEALTGKPGAVRNLWQEHVEQVVCDEATELTPEKVELLLGKPLSGTIPADEVLKIAGDGMQQLLDLLDSQDGPAVDGVRGYQIARATLHRIERVQKKPAHEVRADYACGHCGLRRARDQIGTVGWVCVGCGRLNRV